MHWFNVSQEKSEEVEVIDLPYEDSEDEVLNKELVSDPIKILGVPYDDFEPEQGRVVMRENNVKPAVTRYMASVEELDSDDISRVNGLLKERFPYQYGGLEETGMGTFSFGKSMPRFQAVVGKRFVQIIHEDDHWICASNIFGETSHNVHIYDSMYRNVKRSTVVQVTSLLRAEDEPDFITFHVREYQQQTPGTRLCGYYAVAALFSCCLGVDPSGIVYDEKLMAQHLRNCLSQNVVALFKGVATSVKECKVVKEHKLHCHCQTRVPGTLMVQSTSCLNWYHKKCVTVLKTPVRDPAAAWRGPCCMLRSSEDPIDI